MIKHATMKLNNKIVTETAQYVTEYLHRHLAKDFYYHDILHTTYVVNAVEFLCSAMDISEPEKNILLVAAWFHDTGFTKDPPEHEKESAFIASQFLKNKNVDDQEIAIVTDSILATKLPQQPVEKIQQILCDADLLYLADTDMIQRANLLRREWAAISNKVYTDKEWYALNIQFLTAHSFHTQYCRDHFSYLKLKNIQKLAMKLVEVTNYAHGTAKNIAA